ncbi:hypothetical protein HII36_35855 [Nonomuraea sp. NN258]|uniref:hypothetical protein n=1 Tax=Nonomuraea antri TaxID=2730852 RepID=UPI00156904E8|nr:hypothetical protein [Nonomuraea antri]NRQ37173.1 hypothetical protein [Nonomuraea antri]
MNTISEWSNPMPYLFHDLVNDRIQTLHREAAEQRLASRVNRVQRARREVQRANDRLRRALGRQF